MVVVTTSTLVKPPPWPALLFRVRKSVLSPLAGYVVVVLCYEFTVSHYFFLQIRLVCCVVLSRSRRCRWIGVCCVVILLMSSTTLQNIYAFMAIPMLEVLCFLSDSPERRQSKRWADISACKNIFFYSTNIFHLCRPRHNANSNANMNPEDRRHPPHIT